MDTLDLDLDVALPPDSKLALVKWFWGYKPAETFDDEEPSNSPNGSLNPYFEYYYKQCELIALYQNEEYSSLKTHRNIVDVAALIQQTDQDRPAVLAQLPGLLGSGTDAQQENTLQLVSRLLTMTRIGEIPHEFISPRPTEWKDGTLTEFVRDYFSPSPVLGHERIKFEKTFNGLSLSLITGLEIRWTDNLADHLRLMNNDTTVCVFHHATFLLSQGASSIFLSSFVSETLRTLALLIPKYDKNVKTWYGIQAAKYNLDPAATESGYLIADERQVESFRYWHDRLVVLKQVYDESRPNTLSQWWHDRRNSVQWYTFWVALLVLFLTVFFGLVQCIEGALQVYVSFNPPAT
ncbi:hypothetical protein B0H63DRAFT_473104 [Podospora didyma]|uniref:Uncharacterized protein n=1 Tax=Podospora didyma TaxID=330526 RepID=A0AAE0TZM9_9PEZI|nr:hypothetical protein B0H63DRAFT_473104 [Podospora didyma]